MRELGKLFAVVITYLNRFSNWEVIRTCFLSVTLAGAMPHVATALRLKPSWSRWRPARQSSWPAMMRVSRRAALYPCRSRRRAPLGLTQQSRLPLAAYLQAAAVA